MYLSKNKRFLGRPIVHHQVIITFYKCYLSALYVYFKIKIMQAQLAIVVKSGLI